MKNSILLFLFVLTCSGVRAANTQDASGSLVYSDGTDGNFKSLVYQSTAGKIFRVFDKGLSFSYDSRYDAGNLSPDGAYSVIHFSEAWENTERMSSIYLCAFVRMADGCVVNVSTGEQCGGEWGVFSQWQSPLTITGYELTNNVPNINKVYEDYASGRKDLTQVSSPRVLAYFLQGTTLDNLLACDPPRNANREVYSEMLSLLERDGDANNFATLRSAMNIADTLPADKASSSGEKVHDISLSY
jgi:hypothetical protein